jgi:uncharacterized membrane protein
MAAPEKKKTSMGMEENVASMLCYIAGFITGLIFYFSEKENKTVRFHALQSIGLTIFIVAVLIVITIFNAIFFAISWTILGIWVIISTIIWLGIAALWIFLMVRAYMGAKVKLPLIGDICEKQVK